MGYYVKDGGQLEKVGTSVSVDGLDVAAQFEEVLEKMAEKYPQYGQYLHSHLDKTFHMNMYYDIFQNIFSTPKLIAEKQIGSTQTYEKLLQYFDIPENEKENLIADENFYQCILDTVAETAPIKNGINNFFQERSTSGLGERYQEAQQMMRELEKADPFYVSSSKEFKKMKAAFKELSDIQKRLPKIPSEEQYQELLAGYKKLSDASRKYLEKKEGIEPKKGSNADKRLKIAKKLNDFAVFHGGALEAEMEKALEQREENRRRQEQMRDSTNRRFKEQEERKKLEEKLAAGMKNIMRTEQSCYQICGSFTKEINKPIEEMNFVEKCLNAKKKENDFKLPEKLHITEQEAALLVMVSLGTVEVGKHYRDPGIMKDNDEARTYGCVAYSIENLFAERADTEKSLLFASEIGRKKVGESLKKFADGETRELGELLAEGLKRYTAAFASSGQGISEKHAAELKIAANICDMLNAHPEMLKAAQDSALGEKRLDADVLKNYQGAKETYLMYKESIEAKQQLLSADKTQNPLQVKKAALAKIVLENKMSEKMKQHYSDKKKAIDEQMALQMSQLSKEKDIEKMNKMLSEIHEQQIISGLKIEMLPEQKELTEGRKQERFENIEKSPMIAMTAEKMKDTSFMEIFRDRTKEKAFFEALTKEVEKNELDLKSGEAKKDTPEVKQAENIVVSL